MESSRRAETKSQSFNRSAMASSKDTAGESFSGLRTLDRSLAWRRDCHAFCLPFFLLCLLCMLSFSQRGKSMLPHGKGQHDAEGNAAKQCLRRALRRDVSVANNASQLAQHSAFTFSPHKGDTLRVRIAPGQIEEVRMLMVTEQQIYSCDNDWSENGELTLNEQTRSTVISTFGCHSRAVLSSSGAAVAHSQSRRPVTQLMRSHFSVGPCCWCCCSDVSLHSLCMNVNPVLNSTENREKRPKKFSPAAPGPSGGACGERPKILF